MKSTEKSPLHLMLLVPSSSYSSLHTNTSHIFLYKNESLASYLYFPWVHVYNLLSMSLILSPGYQQERFQVQNPLLLFSKLLITLLLSDPVQPQLTIPLSLP